MPTRLEPKFVYRVWGKFDLAPLFIPPNAPAQTEKIGEVWFENGALLIKFLFTTEKLSVQVHPEDPYAAVHHNGSAGKTEMWHILDAGPGSKIALGFDQLYDAPAVRAAAESGAIMNMLRWIEAKQGETFFVPAGTVHALGEGFVVCEIQQTSDVTYRMFDYNRKPPRELHLDHSLNVARLGPYESVQPGEDHLAACDYFVTNKLHWTNSTGFQPTPRARDEAIIILDGSGALDGKPFVAGEVWRTDGEKFHIAIGTPVTALHTYVP